MTTTGLKTDDAAVCSLLVLVILRLMKDAMNLRVTYPQFPEDMGVSESRTK